MAKKIKDMNKAELIAYATSIGIEDVDRYMTVKQIMALITKPRKDKRESAKPLGPSIVFCGACGRHVPIKETKRCPDCKIYHCLMDAAPGTCVKCGLEFDINLRKKDDNKSKKQTD